MHPLGTNASRMDKSKRTGVPGREKNTGISMGEKNGMQTRNGNINKVKAEGRQNTTIR